MVFLHRDCFDVANDKYAQEFAVAYLLKQIEAKKRFEIWIAETASNKGGPASGFPPFIGLTALFDSDKTVGDTYVKWLSERRKHPEFDEFGKCDDQPAVGKSANSSFASAVAIVLGAGTEALPWGHSEEQKLVFSLGTQYRNLNDIIINKYQKDEQCNRVAWEATAETNGYAMDYMVALALAWLHARKRANSGIPVTIPNFPQAPANIAAWPITPDQDGHDLFAGDNSTNKPVEPPTPILPPISPQLLYDKWITVKESDGDVYTGITLKNGDVYEFEAKGSVYTGVFGAGGNGPNGWKNIDYDTKFPLHGGLDPQNAHPYCLLGKLNNYFFIGERRPRQRYLYLHDSPLHLRINDDTPGGGNGQFDCHIKVWGLTRPKVITIKYGPYIVVGPEVSTGIFAKLGDSMEITSTGLVDFGGAVLGVGAPILDANGDSWCGALRLSCAQASKEFTNYQNW